MNFIVNLPSREETIALVQSRWEEAARDPAWLPVEGKFETNAFGQLIVNPPPTFFHNDRAYRISEILKEQLGGHGRTDVPVATIDGVKVPDAGWFSEDRYQQARGKSASEVAPEICVEVMSPGNTEAEMAHKRFLYFDAGAEECWQCDVDGNMAYYEAASPDQPINQSKRCPEFPSHIEV
jgi:Uma2 family endonuclease